MKDDTKPEEADAVLAAGRTSPYRTVEDVLEEARARGLRKAFFVTALALEAREVRAHLTAMASVRARDGTIFECGTFEDRGREWMVVTVVTRAGTHNALQTVSAGHHAMGPFEVMVFVGIGGSRKKGSPIGSIVAAEKVYFPYGGKFSEGEFSARP